MAKKKTTAKKSFSLEAKGFYSDMTEDDMLYAVLIRSPSTAGVVSKIEIPDMTDDYFLFTAKDIPGQNKIKVNENDIYIFNDGPISYYGEELGILCGPDKYKVSELSKSAEIFLDIGSLESAVQEIEKNYKQPLLNFTDSQKEADFSQFVDKLNELPSLDSVHKTNKAIEVSESRIVATREIKTGLYAEKTIEEAEQEIFDSETKEFRASRTLQQVESLWQETSGAFCKMTGETLHVYSPTKWSYLLLDILKQSLGLKDENILIHKTKALGMYSNGIYKNARLAAQVGLASYLTGNPVKLVFSQREQEKYMSSGVHTTITYKTGVAPNGRIKSMNINIEVDVGIKNPFAQEIIDRMVIASIGIYQPENLYIYAKAITSKNPPTSVYPKIIDSQSFFAVESHIQQIVTETHILPDEFRYINSNQTTKFPFNLKINNIKEPLIKVINESDFNRKFFSFNINAKNRVQKQSDSFFALPLRGIGFACGYEGSGYYGKSFFSGNPKIEVTLNADDNLEIHTLKPSSVVEAIWKKTVNEVLQIPPDKITINAEFPSSDIPNIPEETSSNISLMNFLLRKCCLDIQKKRFHEPLPIMAKRQITTSMKTKWSAENFSGTPFHSSAFGAAIVEIELDSYTYMEKIKGIWMCVDCGELFDEKATERALKLSIQQELACLVENERVTCDNYHISFVKSKEPPEQIGEIAHNLIPAAFASALSLALSTDISTLPVSQSLLYKLIKEQETEQSKNSEQPKTSEQARTSEQSNNSEQTAKTEATNENSVDD